MWNKKSIYLLNRWQFYFPVFMLIPFVSFGQSVDSINGLQPKASLTISGQVYSSAETPVIKGLVALLKPDSSLIKATLTDSLGHFTLKNQGNGRYIIRVSHAEFQPKSQLITLSDTVGNLTLFISLPTRALKLNEVSVKEKRPVFEILGDRIVLNVESNPVFSGASALEALSMAPRVTVDPITKAVGIDGKTGVILYQNGRQVYLPADQVVSYLQKLPANSIAKIDILTSPSAQYDAGSSGVILLYTKGINKEGFNGEVSLAAGVGRYVKSNASVSVSLRTAHLQGSFLYTPMYMPTYFSYRSEQQLSGPNALITGFARSSQFNHIANTSHLLRTNWDWQLTRNTTIGAVVQASTTAETDKPTSTIAYQTATNGAQLIRLDAVNQLKERMNNGAANLNIRREFEASKTSLSADLDFAHYTSNALSSANFIQTLPQPSPAESVEVRYPSSVTIRTAKVDLTNPLFHTGQLETGLKYSFISMSNEPQTNQFTPAFGSLVPFLSRGYQYQERTASAYGNGSYSWSRFSLQGGLRLEHTNYRGQSGPAAIISRDYTNLFPSINLQYTTTKKHQYSVSLNRRIIRPSFDLLNPAYVFTDPLTLYSGNPLLLPQLTTTLQGTYSTPKRISLTVVYSYSRNRIAEVIYRVDSIRATTLDYRINFDWEKRIAATLAIPIQITSGWQLQAMISGVNSHFFSTFNDSPTLTAQSTALLRINNTIKGKVWSANVNVSYRTSAVVGYLYYDPLYVIDLGLQRPLGKRATFKLAVTDLTHSLLITNHGNYLNTNIIFHHKYESQRVMLTYTYRFGNLKAESVKERNFGSDAEQERLGGDTHK